MQDTKLLHQKQSVSRKVLIKNLANNLKPGDILFLHGDMGAGKTYFTQEFCTFLDVSEEVTSPTFGITNVYNVKNKPYHILHSDLYRLDTLTLDLLPEIYNQDAISIIEWPDKIPSEIIQMLEGKITHLHIKAFEDEILIQDGV